MSQLPIDSKRGGLNVAVGSANVYFKLAGETTHRNLGALSGNIQIKLDRKFKNVDDERSGMIIASHFVGLDAGCEFKIKEVDIYNSANVMVGSKVRYNKTTLGSADTFTGDGSTKEFTLSHKEVVSSSMAVEVNSVVVTTGFSIVRGETYDKISFDTAPTTGHSIEVLYDYVTKKQLLVTEADFKDVVSSHAGELKIVPVDSSKPTIVFPRVLLNSDGSFELEKEKERELKVSAMSLKGDDTDTAGGSNVICKIGDTDLTVNTSVLWG